MPSRLRVTPGSKTAAAKLRSPPYVVCSRHRALRCCRLDERILEAAFPRVKQKSAAGWPRSRPCACASLRFRSGPLHSSTTGGGSTPLARLCAGAERADTRFELARNLFGVRARRKFDGLADRHADVSKAGVALLQ